LTLSEQPRTGVVHKAKVAVVKSNDSYEDDDFEEASLSKSNQGLPKPDKKAKSAKR